MSDRTPPWAETPRQRMGLSSAATAARVRPRLPALAQGPMLRRLVLIGAGLAGAVLLAAGIIWAIGRSGPREAPVIEAEPRPFRVRPEGMTTQPPPPARPANRAESLAPPPETPRPDLLAQRATP
ncbi:MAG: hypothetical protein NZN45_07440, partial [Rhodovarius sp.]|nr:hypothetical protein [Rhodovarius sp.]